MSAPPRARDDSEHLPRLALRPVLDREMGRRAMSVVILAVALYTITFPRALGPSFRTLLLFAFALLTVSLLAAVPRGRLRAWWPRVRALPALGALVVLAWFAASTLWSQSASASIRATALYAALALLAGGAAARVRPAAVPVGAAGALVLTMALSVGTAVMGYTGPRPWSPWYADGDLIESFQGLYGNRNILAYTLVMLLPGALTLGALRRFAFPLTVLVTGATCLMVVEVRSATGIITTGAVVGLATLGWLIGFVRSRSSRQTRRALLAVAAVGMAAMLGSIALFASDAIARKTTSFSGRTPLWESILRVSSESPWRGFGWGSVWNYHWLPAGKNAVRADINSALPGPLAHGHSAPLDLLPQVGIVGVALMVAFQAWSLSRLLKAERSPGRSWGLLTLFAVNLVGLTEPSWSIPLGWSLLVVVAVVASRLPPHSAQCTAERTASTAAPWRTEIGHPTPPPMAT